MEKKRIPWNKGMKNFDEVKYRKEYYQKNKERFNQLAKDSYHRNKKKWNSRSYTGTLLRKGWIIIEDKCKKCGKNENLEIHHEIYSTTRRGIEMAVRKGRIYKLCKKCHLKEKKADDWTKVVTK